MTAAHVLLALCVSSSATQVLAFGNLPSPMTSFTIHHLPATATTTAMAAASTSAATENQNQSPFSLAYPLTQVVSDIDDTLKSSGGVTVAGVSLGGIDVQYDRGDFYPGVFQFMWELSLYSVTMNQRHSREFQTDRVGNDSGTLSDLTPPKVAVLTARAEEFKVS